MMSFSHKFQCNKQLPESLAITSSQKLVLLSMSEAQGISLHLYTYIIFQ